MQTLIHSTAVIDPEAELHPSVQVGPYCVIGADVKIAADTIIGAHVVISGPTEIGSGNRIFPGAVIGLEPQDLKYQGANSWLKIGDNNIIREYVTVNRATGENEGTIMGNNNLLMAYVHVAHNCEIEDGVVIANNVALAGHVRIESRAVIGGVLGVHQFVHVGKMAMLGGMSRIDRDVPPYMLVEGNPARVRSLNFVGLKRMGLTAIEIKFLKDAFRTLYGARISLHEAIQQLDKLSESEYVGHLQHFLRLSISEGRRGPIPGKR
ncbi:MAG: acyl-ACP--UDP-N-acetylglucosamine O-acyltransferase [Gomphosphaeria aponina SAG 52.96 = DSM 107014]|uniref:Acyl-[acyl-carrier-protein]--UDP-N-acetylglucosamine O-acyltransferase n=1 Tax=Gomphosphaeria aponina SAG 52.96 = DSM 107014 TaxID=1521640 RepID=A0A941JN07_9CHRO|nr:acyl-ACP--UDP-N-acetylglucosamine O-acyltransferase [Gomphosphaeria aponina SAG 52.96 = DSM 107014]